VRVGVGVGVGALRENGGWGCAGWGMRDVEGVKMRGVRRANSGLSTLQVVIERLGMWVAAMVGFDYLNRYRICGSSGPRERRRS
jgi:hypothetical protein